MRLYKHANLSKMKSIAEAETFGAATRPTTSDRPEFFCCPLLAARCMSKKQVSLFLQCSVIVVAVRLEPKKHCPWRM